MSALLRYYGNTFSEVSGEDLFIICDQYNYPGLDQKVTRGRKKKTVEIEQLSLDWRSAMQGGANPKPRKGNTPEQCSL